MPSPNTSSAELRVGDASPVPLEGLSVGLTEVMSDGSCARSWGLYLSTEAASSPGDVELGVEGQVSEGFLAGVGAPMGADEVWLRTLSFEGDQHAWSGGVVSWEQSDLDVVLGFRGGNWCVDGGSCEAVDIDIAFTLEEPLAAGDRCYDAGGIDAHGRCVAEIHELFECQATLP